MRTRVYVAIAVAAAISVAVATAGHATRVVSGVPQSPACARYASLQGTDRAPGTMRRPFRTVNRLVNSLQPGQTGCVQAGGLFVEDVTARRSGTAAAPITLTSASGAPATIRGRFYVTDSANHLVVSNLVLDGRNDMKLPSPSVNGDSVVFDHDEVTNFHTGICFELGHPGYGEAVDDVIQNSSIHDCGVLPANNYHHGIYVEWADGTVITGNAIVNNANRGIQLFPDAQHTIITHNFIASNGEGVIISGDDKTASSDNEITYNVITDSTVRNDVEEWWPGPVGVGNIVTANCIGGPRLIQEHAAGFVSRDNVIVFLPVRNTLVPGGYCGLPPGLHPGPVQRSS